MRSLGGPNKPGLFEDPLSAILGSGPGGLDLVLFLEAGSLSLESKSSVDPRWAKTKEIVTVLGPARADDCQGPP